MAQTMLSLLGMYQYDNSILDNLVLPEALESRRSIIKDNLLMESAELEVLFADFAMLKYAIGVWSQKELPVWQELYDTTQYEYNPIWNKDGTYTDLETRDLTEHNSSVETRNLGGTDINTETRDLTDSITDGGSQDGTTENDVFGYNSETAAHESKVTEGVEYSREGENTHSGTITNEASRTETGTVTDQGSNTDQGTIKRERTEQGNIGITSTQELIEKQRAVVEFNIMNRIIQDFIKRFCILVY